MSEKMVRVATMDGIAVLTLQRPPLNILTLSMMRELDRVLEGVLTDPEARVVVLRSGIEGVFSSGADIKEHLPSTAEMLIREFAALSRQIITFPKPTIAFVDGKCLGGGMEIALCCDVVLATEGSIFGQPEISVGVFPPVGAALYPHLAGMKVATWLLMSGEPVDARRALSMGLVSKVVGAEEREKALKEMTSTLLGKSSIALKFVKRALLGGAEKPWADAMDFAVAVYLEELMSTEDATEGLRAFVEKRPPAWKNK